MVDFIEAMNLMEKGYKVRRDSWGNPDYYWYVDTEFTFDNLWCILGPDGDKACMIRSFIEGDDWIVYKTNQEKCDHNWEEHGCVKPILKYYICKKCGATKTISSAVQEASSC